MDETLNLAQGIMGESIKPTEVDFVKSEVESVVQQNEDVETVYVPLVTSVLQNNIKPTAVYDPEATEQAKEKASLQTPPHMISVLEGQTIVSEGEVVEEDDIVILERLGLLNPEINWIRYLYIALITLTILFLLGFYLFKFESTVYYNSKKLLILVVLIPMRSTVPI